MKSQNILNFIKETREDKDLWICYCEILILPNGRIIKARPSHEKALVNYVTEKYGDNIRKEILETRQPLDVVTYICDKYGIISVWYDLIKSPKEMTNKQKKSLELLKNNKLISNNYNVIEAKEYRWWLWFNENVVKRRKEI